MTTPSDDVLTRTILGDKELKGASLATRILVTHLRREASVDPACLQDKVTELRAFFAKNPFAVNDLRTL
ncbi:hypothetical protein [Chachezhania sediminis]|uniref:hypothetical protein n=1 Tax=Chachezhania sediminis TaxID=2599291 RepID=UPI00131C8E06|nr:hypothetical protein [Chachezhania sediminis]